jgi:hypothetical protein
MRDGDSLHCRREHQRAIAIGRALDGTTMIEQHTKFTWLLSRAHRRVGAPWQRLRCDQGLGHGGLHPCSEDAAGAPGTARTGKGTGPVRSGLRIAALVLVTGGGLLAPASADAAVRVASVSVHRLTGEIYEYDYVLSTGRGAHDRVGVHRVVKVRHGRPVAAPNGVFLVHGDGASFDNDFRLGKTARQSVAVFLASKGIDVWGVDLGWTLVPATTPDLSFMRGWGLQHDVKDVEKALSFSRSVRARTGSSHSRLTLLAYSRGGWIGYALLNQESQEPAGKRNVRAFVPVDTLIETNDANLRTTVCSYASYNDGQFASGVYYYSHQYSIELGQLALKFPNQPAPLIVRTQTGTLRAKSNQQAAVMLGSSAFQGATQIVPHFHQVAGIFPGNDTTQLPTGLVYTSDTVWDRALATASLFEPVALIRDAWDTTCSPTPRRFDDHLKDVTVPVFYLGTEGGIGPAGLYSLTLLGSKHTSSHIITLRTPADTALDFAHCDLWYARNAQQLVWTPLYTWLSHHSR